MQYKRLARTARINSASAMPNESRACEVWPRLGKGENHDERQQGVVENAATFPEAESVGDGRCQCEGFHLAGLSFGWGSLRAALGLLSALPAAAGLPPPTSGNFEWR